MPSHKVPIVGKKIFEWKEQIESQQMLVRDIIDMTQHMKILKL